MGSGGISACDSCGLEYSQDRMKEKVQEIKGLVTVSNIADFESLMKRGLLFLEDGDCRQASKYFNKVLDLNPESTSAYIGLLCSELGFKREEQIGNHNAELESIPLFQKAMRFANNEEREKLNGYSKSVKDSISLKTLKEQEKIENEKRKEQKRLIEGAKFKKAQAIKLAPIRESLCKFHGCIDVSGFQAVGLKTNGSVVAFGLNKSGECNVSHWKDIISVCAGGSYTLGLKSNGRVVVSGDTRLIKCNITDWREITLLSVGNGIMGLKADGTVVIAGDNFLTQSDAINWRNITSISVGFLHAVGLTKDGTVVTAGSTDFGLHGVSNWKDIVSVCAAPDRTIGLTADGTVIAVGRGYNETPYAYGWQDIVAVSAGKNHVIGLKADGTVVSHLGSSYDDMDNYGQCNVDNWKNIVAISTGNHSTVGLRKDGTVAIIGTTCIGLPHIAQCAVNEWTNIGFSDRAVKHIEQREFNQKSCRFCGGEIEGLFKKKCKLCGKI